GFRIPDNKFVLSLIRKLGKPITSTSANISGSENLYKIKDIIKLFDKKVDMIIDAGNIPKRKASTLFDTIEGKIIREGPISEKKIHDVLKG
ncbi:MAG TPA: Sua5/YciO/YrdC/YwlC family protein, partial [archaeon]|nr:Sua5/YciO/YrdC/YwlC family protein [archaeon]